MDATESVDDERQCHDCGVSLPRSNLVSASFPSIAALLVIGNSDADDPVPIEWNGLVDHHLYCASCVSVVNSRRALIVVLLVTVLALAIFLLSNW